LKPTQNDVDLIGRLTIVPSLLNIICKTTGMGFAAIARVTDEKWIACAVKDNISFGLNPGGELPLESTLCNDIRINQEIIVIDNVSLDEKYANHHTPRIYGLQSYISVPIKRKDKRFFGTLCAIDPNPHRLNIPEVVDMFTLFADLISFHLQTLEELSLAEEKLALEHKTDEVRDQFIAILGHDLRNPLTSISMSAEFLRDSKLPDGDQQLVTIISRSAKRMTNLIDNILDFARARLGDGIMLKRSFNEPLEQILKHVVEENKVSKPDRSIEISFDLKAPVYCDSNRIAELFSNLLGNALTHGDPHSPVKVKVFSNDILFSLSVKNRGIPISPQTKVRLFEPFVRGDQKKAQQGLGLGLYIASEIAKAHQGFIEVNSSENETSFTLKIPADNNQLQNETGIPASQKQTVPAGQKIK
jgi:signal transduction histidine kinase